MICHHIRKLYLKNKFTSTKDRRHGCIKQVTDCQIFCLNTVVVMISTEQLAGYLSIISSNIHNVLRGRCYPYSQGMKLRHKGKHIAQGHLVYKWWPRLESRWSDSQLTLFILVLTTFQIGGIIATVNMKYSSWLLRESIC